MNNVNDLLVHPRFNELVARFHTKYERRGPDDCWPWRDRRRNGRSKYGLLRVGHTGAVRWLAHRVAWVLENGPILNGLYVLHRCDNQECVNPKHLFLGTHKDNMADREAKRRAARGEAAGKASFTAAQVRAIRQDPREYQLIARDYGVSPSSIGDIVNGRSWAHEPGAKPVDRSKGVGHRRAKLFPEAVRDIRSGRLTEESFATLYGVSVWAVKQARERLTWRHVV